MNTDTFSICQVCSWKDIEEPTEGEVLFLNASESKSNLDKTLCSVPSSIKYKDAFQCTKSTESYKIMKERF